ncbi:hypothetical protein PPL_00537 [Heterostelium album PN500]|uniref:NAD-dependent epimerase/dehydratase domain-containing protein n=1 Tax=Heterostelium pallidum (strain ATCC 26659 / Pp 5 / PN500) TaxID=670386 RepID=D3AWQ9_HETP5|nr:hypothetical protein PPL_00537 [Heterostelium album PN500]EFA86732.1 hypothetical protein PPL_00537 [Heterostelium album PN500]|eukprot:XP_020438836.1 hypothetical protein PPL_00537 [Heterostelium album PN500]
MSSILVLGATGTIGFQICLAFLNKGFKVYGLVRNQNKADILLKNEKLHLLTFYSKVIPVVGCASDTKRWGKVAETVDVVIEAVSDNDNPETVNIIFEKLKLISKNKPNLVIIYTSGAWIYPSSCDLVDENTPYKPLHPALNSKIEAEAKYLSIGGISIQPTFVYGRAGSETGLYFKWATESKDGVVKVYGKNDQYLSFVHAVDLAQLYLLAALNAPVARGHTFIGCSGYFKTEEIIRTIAKSANVHIESVEFVEPPKDDVYLNLLTISIAATSRKANNLLGWKPTQPSLIDDPNRYLHAWRLGRNNSTNN